MNRAHAHFPGENPPPGPADLEQQGAIPVHAACQTLERLLALQHPHRVARQRIGSLPLVREGREPACAELDQRLRQLRNEDRREFIAQRHTPKRREIHGVHAVGRESFERGTRQAHVDADADDDVRRARSLAAEVDQDAAELGAAATGCRSAT